MAKRKIFVVIRYNVSMKFEYNNIAQNTEARVNHDIGCNKVEKSGECNNRASNSNDSRF